MVQIWYLCGAFNSLDDHRVPDFVLDHGASHHSAPFYRDFPHISMGSVADDAVVAVGNGGVGMCPISN
jgi:hypothetical protein